MYIKRHAEETADTFSKIFGSILVTGPRQAGKTTMLKKVARAAAYVTLDDPFALFSASEHNETFFRNNPPPVFIDKIQYAPDLLVQINASIAENGQPGQFYLAGSQQFQTMKNACTFRCANLALINLLGLSVREKYGISFCDPFLPTEDYFAARSDHMTHISPSDVWNFIHRGSMPVLADNKDCSWQSYYGAYVKSYIERDIHEFIRLEDALKFLQFMISAARRIGQPLNLSSMGREVGTSQTTAKRWMSILETYHIVYLMRPIPITDIKRTVRSSRLYFSDTGLAAYLTGWDSPQALENSPMADVFFENFVLMEILKSYYNRGITEPSFYYCRTKGVAGLDLLIAQNGKMYPLQIRNRPSPHPKDISSFSLLNRIPNIVQGPGGVICLCDQLTPLKNGHFAIPAGYL